MIDCDGWYKILRISATVSNGLYDRGIDFRINNIFTYFTCYIAVRSAKFTTLSVAHLYRSISHKNEIKSYLYLQALLSYFPVKNMGSLRT